MIESLDRSPHHRRGSFKTLHLNEDEFFSHTLKMMMVMMISFDSAKQLRLHFNEVKEIF